MTVAPGTQLGPYEIIEPVGAGGMGEVYRARDTRLDRDVALKVLHPGIADNPTRRARFEREAHAISRVNHPNICAVYDFGEHDGIAYLVMEYIDGESLERRLRRGGLPTTTALRFAVQIADALDAAHRRGIVHRDLKPGNVMLSGQHVKLLDFGLAKFHAGDGVDAATALDATKSLTAERTVLGTLHYMAPEQLEGREADARTDLFAFGAMLHEMFTARKVFDGVSVATVMASILTAEPSSVSSSATGESAPPAALDRVVRRALAKSPDERWQTARDLMNQLQWILEDGSRSTPATASSTRRRRRVAVFAIGAVAALAGLGALATLSRPLRQPVAAPVHLSFLRPAGTILTNAGRPVLTISPDGRRIVFISDNRLYLRSLDASESAPIPDTQSLGLQTPFFSPDGRWVAFFETLSPPWEPSKDSVLKRIPVDGGGAVEICRFRGTNFGATWTVDDQILFATQNGVFTVAARGGGPQKIVNLKPGEVAHGPQLLPDRDHLLLTVTTATGNERWDKAQIIAQSLSSGARTVLIEGGADGRYLDTGHIVYAVGTTLLAVPADVRSLRILGTPVPIVQGVRRAGPSVRLTAAVFAAISQTGNLAYIPDAPARSINVSVDLDGRLTPLPDNGLRFVRVSSDGSQLVAISPGDSTGLWIHSL